MAKPIRIEGGKRLLAKLKNMPQELQEEMEAETKSAAYKLFNEMIDNIVALPFAYSQGELAKGAKIQQDTDLKFRVFNDSAHAGYVEFGTGRRVEVPAELRSLAAEWLNRPSGNLDEFIRRLIIWAKGAGIRPREGDSIVAYNRMAYFMAIHILENGLEARPFFYPAYVVARKQFFENAKKAIHRVLSGK